jgi:hypothetical protein
MVNTTAFTGLSATVPWVVSRVKGFDQIPSSPKNGISLVIFTSHKKLKCTAACKTLLSKFTAILPSSVI